MTGFTFDFGFYDKCAELDVNCNKWFANTNEYFSACLFGTSNQFGDVRGGEELFVWQGFYYTPAGLTPFRNKTLGLIINNLCWNYRVYLFHNKKINLKSVNTVQYKVAGMKYIDFWSVHQYQDQEAYLHFKTFVIDSEGNGRPIKNNSFKHVPSDLSRPRLSVSVFTLGAFTFVYFNNSLKRLKPNGGDIEIQVRFALRSI